MNPVLTQIIKHPECGYILPQAVTFAAMGTNDKTVNALRKAGKLIEGEHFVRVPQRAGMPRIHWTVAGLQSLALGLGTDRAKAFNADLTQWLQTRKAPAHNDSAIQHQPRGYAVPPTTAEAYADYEPVRLQPWQQSAPLAPLAVTDYQEQQTSPGRYSLAELQEMRAIAQTERDGQMLALLDKAITALATHQPAQQSQPAERVVYVQPQKTTNINFLWHWHGGSNNFGNGSMEVFFGLLLVLVLLSGLWVIALVSTQRSQLVYPYQPGMRTHVE
ncbi:hypothetical protein [Stenomitos frigidus]|uniref:Uncharacterized protein n=1 Tax=Stenomitos frigidus ULC18 TaxID=2107698 RepID=A0A2T1EBT0_9CYAN|nr:hypothetical protein [Stenomitos frigidus]PSB30164.1 hypothetical protein C7B82_09415 [Stenomitos frigidus ULC18]